MKFSTNILNAGIFCGEGPEIQDMSWGAARGDVACRHLDSGKEEYDMRPTLAQTIQNELQLYVGRCH